MDRKHLAAELGRLAHALQTAADFEATLSTVVEVARDLVPGAMAASISVTEGRRTIRCCAASDEMPGLVDGLQEHAGEGPCLDAAYEQEIVRVPDLRSEQRWPVFVPSARAAGATSMMCFRLHLDGDDLAVLNLYGSDYAIFDEESEEAGWLVSAHAAVAFTDAERIRELKHALATRDVIGQAKGILMERLHITAAQAFGVLIEASNRSNTKLHLVAEELAATGELIGTRV